MSTSRDEIGSLAERSAQGVVEVVVPDLAAAVSFYLALGFTEHRRADEFAVVTWGDMYLFLAEDRAATSAPRWINLRIHVADIGPVWERARRACLPVISTLDDRSYGLRDFTVRDPFGFDVRFAQVLP